MKKTDLGIALYLLTAIAMLIVTIPSWLLDIFLAFNIAISFTILFKHSLFYVLRLNIIQHI